MRTRERATLGAERGHLAPTKRSVQLWVAMGVTVALALAAFLAFDAPREGDGKLAQLSPTGDEPLEQGLHDVDPSGTSLPGLTYLGFDGATRALGVRGRPLVLNFWAANCAACVREMPALERAYQASRRDVDFLGVQTAEAATLGTAMLARTGVTYPVGRDPKGSLLQALGGSGLPRTIFIAADGTIRAVRNGQLSEAELSDLIGDLGG